MKPGLVFLVGAPRSGTTWLQRLIATDPHVVSPQETDVFTVAVAPLDEAWQWAQRGGVEAWAQRRYKGLPSVMTDEEFVDAVRAFLADVWSAACALKPGATVVLEKSPSHSKHIALIARFEPDARFLHVIRDGRDVAASLVAASEGWGRGWAPGTVGGAAAEWADHVRAATDARAFGNASLEVRYEALRSSEGPQLLREVMAFCGVEIGEDEAAARLDALALGREEGGGIVLGGEAARVAPAFSEPEGFTGAGGGGWQDWTLAQRVQFDDAAGALLQELGYVDDHGWVGDAKAAQRVRARRRRRQSVARAVNAMSTRLRKTAETLRNGA